MKGDRTQRRKMPETPARADGANARNLWKVTSFLNLQVFFHLILRGFFCLCYQE